MYCDKCGAKNEDDAKYCGICGSYIQKDDEVKPVVIDINDSVAVFKPEDGFFFKGLNIFQKAGLYAIGVFCTFLIAVIVFFHFYPEYLSVIASYISRLIY